MATIQRLLIDEIVAKYETGCTLGSPLPLKH